MNQAQKVPGKFACTVCGTCLRLVHTPGVLNYPGGYLPLPACSECGGIAVIPFDDKAKLAFDRMEKNTKQLEPLLAPVDEDNAI